MSKGFVVFGPIEGNEWLPYEARLEVADISLVGSEIHVRASWNEGEAPTRMPATEYQYAVHAPDGTFVWASRVIFDKEVVNPNSNAANFTAQFKPDNTTIGEALAAEKKRIKETGKFYGDD